MTEVTLGIKLKFGTHWNSWAALISASLNSSIMEIILFVSLGFPASLRRIQQTKRKKGMAAV